MQTNELQPVAQDAMFGVLFDLSNLVEDALRLVEAQGHVPPVAHTPMRLTSQDLGAAATLRVVAFATPSPEPARNDASTPAGAAAAAAKGVVAYAMPTSDDAAGAPPAPNGASTQADVTAAAGSFRFMRRAVPNSV